MYKRGILKSFSRFCRLIYLKLFRINDSPQKIALGLGIGVFCGAFPGSGVLVALFFAFLFKVNRAGAILGSVLTNTWLSIPAFLVSLKVGSFLTGTNYIDIQERWKLLLKDFKWSSLAGLSVYKIILPVAVGYLVVSLFIGALAYAAALLILKYGKRIRKRS